MCFVAWPHVPDCCTLPLCSPWWSWCQCSYGESGLQGGTGSASRWQTSLSLCLCENAKQKQWLVLQIRPNSGFAKDLKINLILLPKDAVSGFDRWWHRMFGFYVTCCGGWNSITVESHGVLVNHTSHPGSPFMSRKKHIKRACLPLRATPFRRMAVMAFLMSSSLSSAELTCTTSKSTGTQLNLRRKCKNYILNHPNRPEVNILNTMSTHFQPTWKPLWRDLAARGRCHLQVWELQCVCLHTLQEGAAILQLCNYNIIGSMLLLEYNVNTTRLDCNFYFQTQRNFFKHVSYVKTAIDLKR